MRAEDFRALLKRQPFVPIRLHLTDGTAYDIRRPEMAWLTRSLVEVALDEKDGIPERVEFCSLPHRSDREPCLTVDRLGALRKGARDSCRLSDVTPCIQRS